MAKLACMIRAMAWIVVAGAVGGVMNAVFVDKGFLMPRRETADGVTILRPGWIGNVCVGAVAALVSWGLYGPFASRDVLGAGQPDAEVTLMLSSLVGAVLVGIGGARWLTNEVDKSALRAAATAAASAPSKPDAARQIALATPFQALDIAKRLTLG
jgi:hypothetical protein